VRRQIAIKISRVAEADELGGDVSSAYIDPVIIQEGNGWLSINAQNGILAAHLHADNRAFG
jgi:hypothetical protein